MSNNNLHYIHNPNLFPCAMSVYRHFIIFSELKSFSYLLMLIVYLF